MCYPDAPEGYHWRKGPNGEPTLAKNPGTKGGKMKYDPETGTFKNADATGTPKKKLGDEAELQKTKTKDTLSEKEFDLEMGAVNKRLPGRKIEMEDGGVKYTREVELPNGHKWRQRLDGGWCRFSKKTCYPSTKQSKGQQQALAQTPKWPEPPAGYKWRAGKNGKPDLVRLPGNNGPKVVYDPQTNSFKEAQVQKVEGIPREGIP